MGGVSKQVIADYIGIGESGKTPTGLSKYPPAGNTRHECREGR
jgi:hypothetical protein